MRKISFKTKITLTFLAAYAVLSLYLIGLFYVKTVLAQKEALRQKLMELSYLGNRIVSGELVEINEVDPSGAMTGPGPDHTFK